MVLSESPGESRNVHDGPPNSGRLEGLSKAGPKEFSWMEAAWPCLAEAASIMHFSQESAVYVCRFCRDACIGSVCARRAGRYPATEATEHRSRIKPAKTAGKSVQCQTPGTGCAGIRTKCSPICTNSAFTASSPLPQGARSSAPFTDDEKPEVRFCNRVLTLKTPAAGILREMRYYARCLAACFPNRVSIVYHPVPLREMRGEQKCSSVLFSCCWLRSS